MSARTIPLDIRLKNAALFLGRMFLLGLVLAGQSSFAQAPPGDPVVRPAVRPAATSYEDDQWTGHINYIVGYKRMSTAWAPARSQYDLGLVDFDIRRQNWPVSLTSQLNLSYSAKIPNQPGIVGNFGGTYEFNFGVRKVVETKSRLQPFVGGGGSVLGGSTTSQFGNVYYQEGHSAGLGGWGEAGVYCALNDHWHVGVRAEYSQGNINLLGNRLNAGGLHLNFLIGRHW